MVNSTKITIISRNFLDQIFKQICIPILTVAAALLIAFTPYTPHPPYPHPLKIFYKSAIFPLGIFLYIIYKIYIIIL
jgi:hypothetical protein